MKFIQTNSDLCRKCYTCVRYCTMKAIKIENGKASIEEENCIQCGQCVKNCPQQAKRTTNELPDVLKAIATGHTAAILAPAFAASFENFHPLQIVSILKNLGFKYVYEAAYGAEVCTAAYQNYLKTNSSETVITSPCPSVVTLMEKYYLDLIKHLAPIASPMVIQGRLVKALHPECTTVFIGPCIGKKMEAREHSVVGAIDCVLTFKQLKVWMDEKNISSNNMPKTYFDQDCANIGRAFPISGGLLKTADLNEQIDNGEVLIIEGPHNVIDFLDSFQSGMVKPKFVDILFCEGCIMGPEMVSNSNTYGRLQKVVSFLKERKKSEKTKAADFLKDIPRVSVDRSFISKKVALEYPSEKEITDILHMTNKFTKDDELNCGACGYSTCREKAVAVIRGLAEHEMCFPFMVEKVNKTQFLRDASGKLVKMSQDIAMAIDRIGNSSAEVSSYASNLAEHSSRLVHLTKDTEKSLSSVDEIVDFIHDIASQSNILGINAAIEASRAGAEGRGFAVVAGEVRNLAQLSKTNSEKIRTTLQELSVAIKQIAASSENNFNISKRQNQMIEELTANIEEIASAEKSLLTIATSLSD